MRAFFMPCTFTPSTDFGPWGGYASAAIARCSMGGDAKPVPTAQNPLLAAWASAWADGATRRHPDQTHGRNRARRAIRKGGDAAAPRTSPSMPPLRPDVRSANASTGDENACSLVSEGFSRAGKVSNGDQGGRPSRRSAPHLSHRVRAAPAARRGPGRGRSRSPPRLLRGRRSQGGCRRPKPRHRRHRAGRQRAPPRKAAPPTQCRPFRR